MTFSVEDGAFTESVVNEDCVDEGGTLLLFTLSRSSCYLRPKSVLFYNMVVIICGFENVEVAERKSAIER